MTDGGTNKAMEACTGLGLTLAQISNANDQEAVLELASKTLYLNNNKRNIKKC